MAQKERLLKRLLNQMQVGDRIGTQGLNLHGAEVEYLTKWGDGRLVAAFPDPKAKEGEKPQYKGFYVDELPTKTVAPLVKGILLALARRKELENQQQESSTQKQEAQ